uniref:CS domain-containing protein n=1 Tax=Alexandrium monilatum TaxID=311494 RepID=A0A7S4RTY5_9DINO|mmetsp:Transcript_93866/g.297924  ORF Transcript_93866/g.297924 Transcript_93866/m.297924 type:complete len:425 (-) Transcript_93866:120-1394(-)
MARSRRTGRNGEKTDTTSAAAVGSTAGDRAASDVKSEPTADAAPSCEAIATYSWTDGKKSLAIFVELEGLAAVASDSLNLAWGPRECSLTVAAVGAPPRRRTLRLSNLAGEIEAARLERQAGEDVVVLRLSKKGKKPWQQLVASPMADGGGPSKEETAGKIKEHGFYRSKDNTFFWPVRGWEDTTVPEVDGLLAATPEFRDVFVPVEDWDEVGAISLHKATATALLPALRTAARIVDVGCGTGALLALLTELAPRATLEGLEGAPAVAAAAAEKLVQAAAHFERADRPEAAKATRAAARNIEHGDAFEFNGDGSRNGFYDIVTVGFAIVEKDLPIGIWSALAEGGMLGIPLCDEPLQSAYGKYQARLHFFTKRGGAAFPGLKAPLGEDHKRVEQPVHFELVRPDKESQRREVMRRLRLSGWSGK